MFSENCSEVSSPRSETLYGQNRNEDKERDFFEVVVLKQISVQKFCFHTMIYVLDYICEKPTFSDDKMKLNRKQVSLHSKLRYLYIFFIQF